jgi:hypothetical protein
MSLCLLAGALSVSLGAGPITLAWVHSVEKTRWEETWREVPSGLVLEQARVRGSGAGMDPPPEAQLVDGAWQWKPELPALATVTLRRSGATLDWSVCSNNICNEISALLPADVDPVELTRCR